MLSTARIGHAHGAPSGHAGPGGHTAHTNRLTDKRRQQLLDLVGGINVLPTGLSVPMRVLQLQKAGSAGMPELAEVLSADAALAAKILGLVNSAAFAPARPVTKLSAALGMIGLKNLMPLVFGLSLGGIFNKTAMPADERDALFRAALLKAVAARAVAKREAADPALAEEAFLCGLMQDVGLPAMHGADRSTWAEIASALDLDAGIRREREGRLFGEDHASVGRRVLERLELPDLFRAATAAHHHGAAAMVEAGVTDAGLARALEVAAQLPHRLIQLNSSAQTLSQRLTTALGAAPARGAPAPSAQDVAALAQEILKSYSATLALLGETDEASVAFKQFLQDLCDEVARSMESAVRESTATISGLRVREGALLGKLTELKRQSLESERDELTGTLTRRGFLNRAPGVLSLGRQHQVACVVGFVDVDDFKKVNDTHGHAVGDAALRIVGERLQKLALGRGLVGRMGGDEFAFVMLLQAAPVKPDGATTPNASMLAEQERVSATLSRIPCRTPEGAAVTLTTSVGLVPVGVPRPADTVEQCVARADEQMYVAKRAGKSRCAMAEAA
jgi:diguanylate cyclase (GGDEF)-like protein